MRQKFWIRLGNSAGILGTRFARPAFWLLKNRLVLFWCLYYTKLEPIFKTKWGNRTRGARGSSKLNRTLDAKPRHRLASLGNPKKKNVPCFFVFSRGWFSFDMERTFFFLGFCPPSIRAVWRGEENSVTPRFSRGSALTFPRIFHSCFVCAGFLFWNGRGVRAK